MRLPIAWRDAIDKKTFRVDLPAPTLAKMSVALFLSLLKCRPGDMTRRPPGARIGVAAERAATSLPQPW
jgi:hypothetical protein